MTGEAYDVVGIYCAEPSHPKGRRTAVATFVRYPGTAWQVPLGGWQQDEPVTAVLFDPDASGGQRASHKIECPDCGLSLTRTDLRLQTAFDELARHGVDRVSLAGLVATLT